MSRRWALLVLLSGALATASARSHRRLGWFGWLWGNGDHECTRYQLRGCHTCKNCTAVAGANSYWCSTSKVCVPHSCKNCPQKRLECRSYETECPINCDDALEEMLETPKRNRWRLWDAGTCDKDENICQDESLGEKAPHCFRKTPNQNTIKIGMKCRPHMYLPARSHANSPLRLNVRQVSDRDLCCDRGYVREGPQTPGAFSCDTSVDVSEAHYTMLSDKTMMGRCGEPDKNCQTKCVHNLLRRPVRCCSDNHIPGWHNELCPDVWHSSETWKTAPRECKILSYSDAEAFCSREGGRLCSEREIEMQCVRLSGCGYDNRLIWTNEGCKLQPQEREAALHQLPHLHHFAHYSMEPEASGPYISWLNPNDTTGRMVLQFVLLCVFLVPVLLCLIGMYACGVWKPLAKYRKDGDDEYEDIYARSEAGYRSPTGYRAPRTPKSPARRTRVARSIGSPGGMGSTPARRRHARRRDGYEEPYT